MAFPFVESVTPTTFASNTTAHAVNMPATCNAGDLKLVLFASDGSAAVTTPTGWTLLYSTASSSIARGSAYARVHAEGDPATVDFVTASGEQAAAQCLRISGWYGAIAGGVEARAAEIISSAAPDPSSFSPSWGSADNLWISADASSAAATLTSPPSGYADAVSTISAASTVGAQQYSARKTATAASDDPGAWTFSASQPNIFSTIAIRGASGVTLTPPTGSIAASGTAPSLAQTKAPSTGLASATSGVPARSVALAVDRGSASAFGAQPELTRIVAPSSGSIAASGNIPEVIIPLQLLVPDGGAAMAAGNTPSISVTFAPEMGEVSTAGQPPTIALALSPATGAASGAGNAPAMASALVPETGVVSAIGSAPSLSLTATSGLVSAIGNQPTLTSVIVTQTALIDATGQPDSPPLFIGHVPTASGAVSLSGAAPALARYYLPTSATVTASGNAPTAARAIAPAAGLASAAGAQPAAALTLKPSSGAAPASGNAPDFGVGTALVPQPGLIAAVGNAPELDLPDPATLTLLTGNVLAPGAQPALTTTYCPPSGRAIWIGNRPAIAGLPQVGSICTLPLLNRGMKIMDVVAYLA